MGLTKPIEQFLLSYQGAFMYLKDIIRGGKLYGKKKLLLSAFGVGMTWATGIVPFVDCKISDIVEI